MKEMTSQREPRAPFASALDLTDVDQSFRDRFWEKVDVRGADECWEWRAHRKVTGYGQFTISKGVFATASRVSLALSGVVLREGEAACHRCDNPPCVNPAHLFAGTQVVNTLDCVEKGRANRASGTDHPSARLDHEAVRRIRSADLRFGDMTRLAREYGVSLTSIRRIRNGQTWRDVA